MEFGAGGGAVHINCQTSWLDVLARIRIWAHAQQILSSRMYRRSWTKVKPLVGAQV